jgi:hypothetical protein
MKSSIKGAVIATAAASLFAAKVAVAEQHDQGQAGKKVHCEGVNECKGKGECGGAGHDCAGNNQCKGKGWISLSDAECKAKGGTAK